MFSEFLSLKKKEIGCMNAHCGGNWRRLDYHHVQSTSKLFGIGGMPANTSLPEVIRELRKCIVLCGVCHRRAHSKNITLLNIRVESLVRYQELLLPHTYQHFALYRHGRNGPIILTRDNVIVHTRVIPGKFEDSDCPF